MCMIKGGWGTELVTLSEQYYNSTLTPFLLCRFIPDRCDGTPKIKTKVSFSKTRSEPFQIENEKMGDFYEIINLAFDENRLVQCFAKLGPFLPGEIKICPLTDYLKKCMLKKMVAMGICPPSKKISRAYFGFNTSKTSAIKNTSFLQHFVLHLSITDSKLPNPVWPDMADNVSNESETLVIKVDPNSI